MTESKPTRGHYTFVHQFNVECDRRGIANCGGYSPSHGQQEAFEENKANALLVADAFNVYNETGLTPRQLAEQRAMLLDALDIAEKEIRAWRAGINTRTGLNDLAKANVGSCFGGIPAITAAKGAADV